MSDEHPTSPPPHQATNDDGPPLPSSSLVEELPPGNSFPSTAIDAVDYFLKQSLQKIDDLHELGALAAVCNLIGEDRTKVNEIQIYGSTGGFDCPGTITFWSDAQRLVTLNMEPLTGRVFTIQKREAEPGVSDTYSIGPLIPAEHQEHFQDFKLKLLADRRAGDMYMQSSRKRIFCFQAGNTWSAISTSQYSNVFSLGLLKAFLAENFRSKADFEDVGTLEELRRRTIVIVGLIPPQGNPEVVRPADFFLWMAYQPYDAIKLILDHYHLTVSPCVGAFLCRVCSGALIVRIPPSSIRRCAACLAGEGVPALFNASVLCRRCKASLVEIVDLFLAKHGVHPAADPHVDRQTILMKQLDLTDDILDRLIFFQEDAIASIKCNSFKRNVLFPNENVDFPEKLNPQYPFAYLNVLFLSDLFNLKSEKRGKHEPCVNAWKCTISHCVEHCVEPEKHSDSPLLRIDLNCPKLDCHLRPKTWNRCTSCRLLAVARCVREAKVGTIHNVRFDTTFQEKMRLVVHDQALAALKFSPSTFASLLQTHVPFSHPSEFTEAFPPTILNNEDENLSFQLISDDSAFFSTPQAVYLMQPEGLDPLPSFGLGNYENVTVVETNKSSS